METSNIEPAEVVPASRKLQADDAAQILKKAKRLVACKGKKVAEFDVGKAVDEDAIAAMLGPTGNMRSPTIITGNLVIVGFNEDVFSETFS